VTIGGAYIDSPATPFIASNSVVLDGWVALPTPASTFEIRINGKIIRLRRGDPRSDVAERFPGMQCMSWAAFVDIAAVVDARQVLVADVFIDGHIVHRGYFRCKSAEGSPRPLVYFLHIAKTGGTSVRASLERWSNNLPMLHVYDEGLVDPAQYLSLSDSALSQYDIVYGHFWHGLHQNKSRPYRYVTLLRDPYEFIASNYFYRKYERAEPKFTRMKSIFEALEDPALESTLDNMFVRCIGGCDEARRVGPDDLATALVNMRNDFDLVCFTDEMERTVSKLASYFGVPLEHKRLNVTRGTAERTALDWGAFMRAAKPLVKWDLELCAAARRTFDQAASANALGIGSSSGSEDLHTDSHASPSVRNTIRLVNSTPPAKSN